MPAVDTNVLVRLIVGDDPGQRDRAERALAEDGPFWIPVVTLLETAWVLECYYRLNRTQLAGALRDLTESRDFTVQTAEAVQRALQLYASGKADLPECLALEQARAEGHLPLVTFDRKAGRLSGGKSL